MKKRLLPGASSCVILAAYLAIHQPTHATTQVTGTLINVDFDGTGGAGGSTDPVTFDGDLMQNEVTTASVAFEDADLETNDFWNGFLDRNLTNQTLLDSAGAATTVILDWSGFDGNYTNYLNGRDGSEFLERTDGPNGDGHLIFNAGSTRMGTVTLRGLNAGTTYDVVAIGGGSDPVTFTIGSESQAIGEWNSTANPSNWAIFNQVVPNAAGTIVITVSNNLGRTNFGIGGLQITPIGTVSDTDGDGIPDVWEDANGLDKTNSADGSLVLSPLTDPDGDLLANVTEFNRNTNPQKADTDDDGYNDNVESGTGIWVSLADTGSNPLLADTDGDGLPDGTENPSLPRGSDPNKRDTDGDGFTDKAEIDAGTDPSDPLSSPRRVVSGTLINYDFNGDVPGRAALTDPVLFNGDLARDVFTSASVPLEDSNRSLNDVWNGAEGTDVHATLADVPQETVDSLGNPTDITVEWSGFAFNYTNYTNGTDGGGGFTHGPNGDGFFATTTALPTVTIRGLNPALAYDIATIGAGDPVKFIVAAEEVTIPMWNSTLNPSNWTVFSQVAPGEEGEIIITVASINGQTNFGIGGVQIAGTSPVVPPAGDFKIVGISRNAATGEITLTWTSTTGKTYAILWSETLTSIATEVPGQTNLAGTTGTMTSTFAPPVAAAPVLYFRVREQ